MAKVGGARKGAGRKRGKKLPKTIERQAALLKYQELGMAAARKLFQVQMMASLGTHKMIVVTEDELGVPHVTTVKDQDKMDKLLLNGDYGKDYMVVAGHAPDTRAADAILDRTFGRPIQSTDITSNGKSIDVFSPEQLLKVASRVIEEHGDTKSKG